VVRFRSSALYFLLICKNNYTTIRARVLLEPPSFMALNNGRRTPMTVIVAHLLYGAILGAFYRMK
jgi:hypothetical protein